MPYPYKQNDRTPDKQPSDKQQTETQNLISARKDSRRSIHEIITIYRKMKKGRVEKIHQQTNQQINKERGELKLTINDTMQSKKDPDKTFRNIDSDSSDTSPIYNHLNFSKYNSLSQEKFLYFSKQSGIQQFKEISTFKNFYDKQADKNVTQEQKPATSKHSNNSKSDKFTGRRKKHDEDDLTVSDWESESNYFADKEDNINQHTESEEKKSDFFWLNIFDPSHDDLKALGQLFQIHSITLQDIKEKETREKIEMFHSYIFISLRLNNTEDGLLFRKYTDPQTNTCENCSQYLSEHASQNVDNRKFENRDFPDCKCQEFSEDTLDKKDIDFNIILFNDKIITMHDTKWSSIFEILSFTDLISNYTELVPEWVLFSILVELLQDLRYFIDQMDPIIKNLQTSIVSSQNGQIIHSNDIRSILNRRIPKASIGRKWLLNPLTSNTESFKHAKDEDREEMVLHENFLLTNDLWSLRRAVKPKLVILNALNKNSRIKLKRKFYILLNDFHRLEKDIKEERKLLERLQDLLFGIINLKQSKENNDLSKTMKTFTVISLIFLPLQTVSGLWGMNVRVPGEKGDNLLWFFLLTIIGPFFTGMYMIVQKIYMSKKRSRNKKLE